MILTKNFPVLVQGEIFRICHMDIHCMHISSHTIRELPEQVVVKPDNVCAFTTTDCFFPESILESHLAKRRI